MLGISKPVHRTIIVLFSTLCLLLPLCAHGHAQSVGSAGITTSSPPRSARTLMPPEKRVVFEASPFEEGSVIPYWDRGYLISIVPESFSPATPNVRLYDATGTTNNRIRLLSLSGQPSRELMVKNWSGFTSLDWAADSKGLFVSSNPAGFRQSLLYVDLAGNAHQIWEVNHVLASWAIPSRNGKYLAILAPTADSNVWMAENF